MLDWLKNTTVLHNPIELWLIAAAAALIGYLLVHTILRSLAKRLRQRRADAPESSRSALLTVLESTQRWLILALAVVLAAGLLSFPARAEALLGHAGFGLIGLQIALWANALIDLWLRRAPRASVEAPINPVLLGMLVWAAQLVVWVIVLLAFLSNVGVNVTTLVASLGIGGVAIALALQNILGDLFASIAIGLDKPFEVGQVIAFDGNSGTVRHVGVKTTRIDSLSGEQLVISNSELLKELVRNYSRMSRRRVVFGFRVPYGTTRTQAAHIVAQTRSFIEGVEQAQFDRGHLVAFGEYALEFEFVYYVLSADYTVYRNVQQQVNFLVMDLLADMSVRFAVPARTLHTSESPIVEQ